MPQLDLSPDQKQYIDDYGLFFEATGLPRMAGRILGWLMISRPPEQSAEEIGAALDGSRGTVSTMTRLLIQMGLIERASRRGERRDYFRIQPGVWNQVMAGQAAQMARLRTLAERGLGLLEGAPPADRQRLEEMRAMFAFFEREIPAMMERYRQQTLLTNPQEKKS